jgi:amidase
VPDLDVDQACVDAVQETGRLLEALGHQVVDSVAPKAFAARGEDPMVGMIELVATVRHMVTSLSGLLGREAGRDDMEPFTWAIADAPFAISAAELVQAQVATQSWAVEACRWWDEAGIDVLVTPTVHEPPCLLNEMDAGAIDPTSLGMKVAAHCAFTEPFNVTGEPAISLPLHWTGGGLPVGIQLVAPFGREDLLLKRSAQLEQARPWSERWMEMASRLDLL